MNLWNEFKTNHRKSIHKWTHYFPIYNKILSEFKDRTINVLEIGVLDGGSLELWHRYFGPNALIVGIDNHLQSNSMELIFDSPMIQFRKGDQSDPDFLNKIINEFGEFDVIIDDGSHISQHVITSFELLYPYVTKNGMYIIEDTHTSYWESHGGGYQLPNTTIEFAKRLIDELNASHTKILAATAFTQETQSITFYDSMIVLKKGGSRWKQPVSSA
jgi:cephalosporin hydroxylase